MTAEVATSASDEYALLGHDWYSVEGVGHFTWIGTHSVPYMMYPLS